MSVKFFEDGFDYKKYIDERLLEVPDMAERHQLRNVMSEMLIPFYENVEQSYKQIEGRLFSDFLKLIEPTPFIYTVSFVLILIGMIVGMFGSSKAVRKYLKI